MITLLSGFAAGSLHVLSGPDHLAALAPMAAADHGRATSLGFRWGLGHGLGAAGLGLLALLGRGFIHVESWSAGAEAVVGLALVGLGVWSWHTATRPQPAPVAAGAAPATVDADADADAARGGAPVSIASIGAHVEVRARTVLNPAAAWARGAPRPAVRADPRSAARRARPGATAAERSGSRPPDDSTGARASGASSRPSRAR